MMLQTHEIEQVTSHDSNNQLLYFTSTSLLKDNAGLVFISDRTGDPNLFYLNFKTREERQLTNQAEGYLRSYIYFDGNMYQGFGKASVTLHADSGTVYYLQGRNIMSVQITGESRKIAELPYGQMTGFTNISADNRYLCIPTTDADAFNVTSYWPGIDNRIHDKKLFSYLRVFDVQTGEMVLCEPVPNCWITHVSFCPTDSSKILYNHEWVASDQGIRRMWLFDGEKHIQLRTEDEKRSRKDHACHEMWEKNGDYIIYHGGYFNGRDFIGRLNVHDLSYHEVEIDERFRAYGHFTVMDTGALVSDGYYGEEPDDFVGKGKFISIQLIDWENETLIWKPLCRHKSSWNCQCSHPHPIFDHGDQHIYFTSDPTGKRQVYRIKTSLS